MSKVLIVHAHPEPKSLTSALKDFAVETLEAQGHEVQVSDLYGEGVLSGRRAMIMVTMGGHEAHYSARGVNGALDDVLWPIQHGVLFYPGMQVLPPFVVYQTHRLTEADWPEIAVAYRRRLDGLFTDAPIPFRSQNGGHYDQENK